MDGPRSPDEHDLTGTGSPRSADDGAPGDAPRRDGPSSQPASADEVRINRSGSGGSGGPATPDRSVEGSTPASMSELLSGEDDAEPRRD